MSKILSAKPAAPKAVLLIFVLLNAWQPRQTKSPATFVKAICGSLGAEYRICSKPAYNFRGPLVYLASTITAVLSEIVAVSTSGRNGGIGVPLASVLPPQTAAHTGPFIQLLNAANDRTTVA